MENKNYGHRSWIGILLLIVVLVVVAFIPPQTIGSISLRRANIISDIIDFDAAKIVDKVVSDVVDLSEELTLEVTDELETVPTAIEEEILEFEVDIEKVEQQIIIDTVATDVEVTYRWDVNPQLEVRAEEVRNEIVAITKPTVVIDEFASEMSDSSRMARFYKALVSNRSHVRIAVLGDSFIEADIITADLREGLQSQFGGHGSGFAPMDSPLTGYRRTIKTKSKGWTSYNIMQRKNAPESLRDRFTMSGWVSQAKVGAQSRWESTDVREHLKGSSIARIFFTSELDSRVEVVVNDVVTKEFSVAGAEALRQIEIRNDSIESLTFRVLSGESGLVGYGVVFESEGVTVDNYSVRSNSGQAMFMTNPSLNAQFNNILNYDLVILQYGLNIMEKGRTNYAYYAKKVVSMVDYVNRCFPTADVVVLGVSDRSVRVNGAFVTMDAIPYLLRYQSLAAKKSGASFWNTYEAMGSIGGMSSFVSNGWAAKDYTHINFGGGAEIAKMLTNSIVYQAKLVADEIKKREVKRVDYEGVVRRRYMDGVDGELRAVKFNVVE